MSTALKITTETGVQLFNRLHVRPSLDKIHPNIIPSGPEPNKIIQITGPPNTGKSLLICELIVHTILPKELSDNFKESSAIFINSDHQISLIQIIKVAEKKLTLLNIPSDKHLDIVKDALKRSLEHLLSDNLNVALLAIDSLSAYYWSERYALSTIAMQSDTPNSEVKMFSVNKHCANLLKILKTVINDRQIVTVFSKYETDVSLSSMIDYSISLSLQDNCDNKCVFLLQFYKHETKLIVTKTYEIDVIFVFK